MARPKKVNQNQMATLKIEDAFWELLETKRFPELTVLQICHKAGVNRNSFYYHYQDIYDLAYKAFRNPSHEEIYQNLLSRILSFNLNPSDIDDDKGLLLSQRIMVCARNDSSELKALLIDFLEETWFESLSIDKESISKEDRLQVIFIFEGLLAILGSQEVANEPLIMSSLSQMDIGKLTITTLKNISSIKMQ